MTKKATQTLGRTKAQIQADLKAAAEARAALPELQRSIEKESKAEEELQEWERPFDQRREAALTQAQGIVAKIHAEEETLKRHIRAECESPMWRSARSLIAIADLRQQLQDRVSDALRAEYDRALAADREDNSPGGLLRAKARAAEVAGQSAHKALMESLDPLWSPVRGLSPGPERDITMIIASLLWPRNYERPVLDPNAKGS